ncbi:hypothetical protein BDQ17DRAFT_1421208 [Cyathus striatus]|nr:hypothetical protein BDQ17DRAFT_1421208 [Cyathus striatus]
MSHGVQPHLIGLPYELQLSILRLWTCRQMYFAASDKRLWIDVLKDICEENSVFLATYSFEDMSLEELRHSPQDLIDLCYSLKSGNPRTITSPPREVLLSRSWGFGNIRHLPGSWWSILVRILYGKVLLFDLLHHCDGLGLRVVLLGDNDDQRISEFKIFDIYPLCPKPEFINIATLNHPGEIDLRVLSICGDFIVFIDDRTVKIWNFVTHKATLWKVTEQFDQVIATDTTILLSRKMELVPSGLFPT